MENSEAINPNDLADPDSLNRYVDGGGYGLSSAWIFYERSRSPLMNLKCRFRIILKQKIRQTF